MTKPNVSITTTVVSASPKKLKVTWTNPTNSNPCNEIWLLPKVKPFMHFPTPPQHNAEFDGMHIVTCQDYVLKWLKKTFKKGKDYKFMNAQALQWEMKIAVTEEVLIMMQLTFQGQ